MTQDELKKVLESTKVKILINDLRPFAENHPVGSLKIGMDEVRVIVEMYDAIRGIIQSLLHHD